MSLNRQFRQATPAPVVKAVARPHITSALAKPKTAGAKRGPKPSGNAKILLTLRLDPAIVAKFKASGPGWQSRINDLLKSAKL